MGRDEDKRARFDIGAARALIRIQTATAAQDAYGEAIQTWATVDRRRADVHALAGVELLEAQKVQANATHKGRARYSRHLTPDARVVAVDAETGTSRTLELFSVVELGRRDVQEFLARELVV